jgi:hypothetical protein
MATSRAARLGCGDIARLNENPIGLIFWWAIYWWARQPPYEAAFLEGSLGLIKMLIQRVPTKIPTKLPREEDRSAALRAAASGALVVHRVR